MVAALAFQRDAVSQRLQQLSGPGASRENHVVGMIRSSLACRPGNAGFREG